MSKFVLRNLLMAPNFRCLSVYFFLTSKLFSTRNNNFNFAKIAHLCVVDNNFHQFLDGQISDPHCNVKTSRGK